MIKYIVNKEKGVVVAYMEGCMDDARVEAMKRFGIDVTNSHTFGDFLDMPNTFKGVARLKNSDVFDENIGKNVAKAKLLRTYFNVKANTLYKFREAICNTIKIFDKDIVKAFDVSKHQAEKVKEF